MGKQVKFDTDLASKVWSGQIKGHFQTREGNSVRILALDMHNDDCVVAIIRDQTGIEYVKTYLSNGEQGFIGSQPSDLVIILD